jgi:hypothetical protein
MRSKDQNVHPLLRRSDGLIPTSHRSQSCVVSCIRCPHRILPRISTVSISSKSRAVAVSNTARSIPSTTIMLPDWVIRVIVLPRIGAAQGPVMNRRVGVAQCVDEGALSTTLLDPVTRHESPESLAVECSQILNRVCMLCVRLFRRSCDIAGMAQVMA